MSIDYHTPTPWTLKPYTSGDKYLEIPEAGLKIDYDDFNHEEARSNAEFIILSTRLHHTLVRMLERSHDFIQIVGTEDPDDVETMAKIEILSGQISYVLSCAKMESRHEHH